jgi:hypothetical protein
MRFHAYPRQFSGRPASLVEEVVAPVVVEAVVPEVERSVAVAPVMPRKSKGRWVLLLLILMMLAGGGLAAYWYFVLQVEPEASVIAVVPQAPVVTPPVVEPPPPSEPVRPIPGTDTDSDGLTNVEELLYKTDFRNPDSDGDTFLDGNEVFHRYNPGARDASTLMDVGTVKEYLDGDSRFSVTFPSAWRQTVSVAGDIQVEAPSLAVFSVQVLPKDLSQTLEAWYAGQTDFPKRDGGAVYLTKMGYQALAADEDRLVVLDGGEQVYVFRYGLAEGRTVEYLQSFKMVVNSFKELP